MDAPGKPQAWCETRQELCEGLPYFRSFQSGLYKQDGLAKGYLIDGFCAERDMWNGKVFISHGGGSQAAPRAGTGLKAKKSATCVASRSALPLGASQQETHSAIRALNATLKAGLPFVVIMGAHYSLADFKIPHRYCVLGYYVITDCWNEKEYVDGDSGEFHVRWKFRFEWAEGNPHEPWFRTTLHQDEAGGAKTTADPYKCAQCSNESPAVYTVPMCLKSGCPRFWQFLCCDQWHNPPPDLELNKRFISPRPRSISYSSFISENLSYASSSRLDDRGCAVLQEGSRIIRYEDVIADNPLLDGLRRVTYLLPTGGRIEHIRARPGHELAEEGEAIFRQFQHDVELQRWRHTVHRVKGFVTQNYCHNAGRAYSHAVKLPATDIKHDPAVIQRSRQILQEISPQSKINELLSMFYLQGQKMAFHDDGEHDVQGPIVGWSLGSDSIMRFREKTPSARKGACSKASSRVKRKRDEGCELSQATAIPAVLDGASQGMKRQRSPPPPTYDGKLYGSEDRHNERRQPALLAAELPSLGAALANRSDAHSECNRVADFLKADVAKEKIKVLASGICDFPTSVPNDEGGSYDAKLAVSVDRHNELTPVVVTAESPSPFAAGTVDVQQLAQPSPSYGGKLRAIADAHDLKPAVLAAELMDPPAAMNDRFHVILQSRKVAESLEADVWKSKRVVLCNRLCESLKVSEQKRRTNLKSRLRRRLAKERSRNNVSAPTQEVRSLPSPPVKSIMALSSMLNPLPRSPKRNAPVSPPATPADPPSTGDATILEDLDINPELHEVRGNSNPEPAAPIYYSGSEPPEAKVETNSEYPEPSEPAEVEADLNPEPPEPLLETKGNKPAGRPQRKTVLELLTRHGDVVIMIGPSVQRYYEHAAQPTGLRLCVTGRTLSAPGDVGTYVDPPWTPPPGAIRLPPFYKRKTTAARNT
ncbi:hypothetical protein HDU87_007796 [Geranomyces variabilis]|uniref:Alpha-ketoglutarate-dependent dioxygenase AlkB-like domain-containing protein n=1 Tax=Geranomyces variabilis TaxID=109894 RepID=A0AAD5TEP9_9FUNG|nr:hypothetical protein HDU87_007796 [Geranomyces variabilis]